MVQKLGIAMKVAIGDPGAPDNVIKPNADGSINVVGGGGGGGGASATASAAALPVIAGVNKPVNIDLLSQTRVLVGDAAGNAVDWTSPVPVNGVTASDSPITAAPLTVGGRAANALPAAVSANGDVVNAMLDLYGRQIARGALRELMGDQYTTLSSGSATDFITADASNKLDLYGLIVANTTSGVVDVLIEDGTTDRMTITVPADFTSGFMLPVDSGYKQAAVNTAWRATGVSGVNISALYVKQGA